jgi:hypothetical protein
MPRTLRLLQVVRFLVEDRQRLALENVAFRNQLTDQKRSGARPEVEDSDRIFWSLIMRML